MVRPRGWHLHEKHVLVDGEPCPRRCSTSPCTSSTTPNALLRSAARARTSTCPSWRTMARGEALERRVRRRPGVALGMPVGTIKATVLIETLLAAFEMDEILWELRDHSPPGSTAAAGTTSSASSRRSEDRSGVRPARPRATVGMDPALPAVLQPAADQTCHRRGMHAMGGMAAQIPIKGDEARNEAALEKVRADKRREATDGHDGTWVAHPGLVADRARRVRRGDASKPTRSTTVRDRRRSHGRRTCSRFPDGAITEAGLRQNLSVGIRYLAAWLRGSGCVPLYDLMEDAATAEISRAQVWQWMHHGARSRGRPNASICNALRSGASERKCRRIARRARPTSGFGRGRYDLMPPSLFERARHPATIFDRLLDPPRLRLTSSLFRSTTATPCQETNG